MRESGRVRGRENERVGGDGVKTYDTQGGGGACESLEDAERMGGNKNGKGEPRVVSRIE